jgi:peptidylprolyl isomerase
MRKPSLSPILLAVAVGPLAPAFAADDISLTAPADVAAPPAAAESTASGLAFVVLKPGVGERHPGPASWVRVDYAGWTTDGELFDNSIERGASLSLPLDRVIKGWSEALQLMVEGERRRVWIPEELAYAGLEDRPQGMLVFDIELDEIVDPPAPPENLTAPPADAERHKKGLASKVLQPGTGDQSPRETSMVSVLYSGWTTDGKMFDSTVFSGAPATFPLNGVIKGWADGLQLMVVGEKRRLWIPEKLAYKGAEGKPKGMLIFDVELVAIPVY